MKRILIVSDSLKTGGLEKTLIDLCDNLDYNKFQVDLYLFAEGRDLLKNLNEHVNLLQESPYFSDVYNKSVWDSLKILLKKGKIQLAFYRIIRFLKARLKNKSFSALDWYFQKKTMLKIEDEYDVAIGFAEGSACYYVGQCVKAKRKCVWVHTDIREIISNKKLDMMAFSVADCVCTVSNNSANALKELYPKIKEKIRIFTLPALFDYNKINELASIPCEMQEEDINILSVGRLVELKGFHLCPQVLRELLDKGYNVKWYIAGDGPYREILENLIDKYKLYKHFILLGNQDNPYKYIKNADICVQPSSYEGLSLVIYEEKLLKKPVVCTDILSNLEMIKNGENGLIIERSSESIYKALKLLIDNEELRLKLGNTSSKNYVSKETIINMIENTMLGF